MQAQQDQWELRVAELWARADGLDAAQLVAAADALAAERPAGDAAALFERASARDTAGLEAQAEPLYRAALITAQLDPLRRARAAIQLASTLRILGRLDESEQLLTMELRRHAELGSDRQLHDEARAFLALTYVAQGRSVEAAGLALRTLAPYLTRYNRSVGANAARLVQRTWD